MKQFPTKLICLCEALASVGGKAPPMKAPSMKVRRLEVLTAHILFVASGVLRFRANDGT